MTDDKSDTPAVAEFVMTNDCRVGVSRVEHGVELKSLVINQNPQ
jgi:hypothetical protein